MALTTYTLHVIWHAITFRLFGYPGLIPSLIIMIAVFLLAASLWRLRFGKGPLEAFLARLSNPPAGNKTAENSDGAASTNLA